MSPDPFFRLDSTKSLCQPISSCQSYCRGAAPGGFCGARIHPDCLRISDDGLVSVGLSAPARTWFTTMVQLGDVLELTRNPVAVMGQLGAMPELTDWHSSVLPRDRAGSFAPNLAEYAALRAVRESSPMGVIYGLEAQDVSGYAFQRIILTSSARHDLFERFVTDHQSSSEESIPWFAPNHNASFQRSRSIATRMQFLRSLLASGSKDACQLPINIVPQLLAAAAKVRLPIRTIHYSRALIRAAAWTPDSFDRTPGQESGVEFFHGDGVGLHINFPAIAGAWLWQGRCVCCDKQHWTVEAADVAEAVALAFTAGCEALELDWRELLKGCLS
jgi:hypothetical protein